MRQAAETRRSGRQRAQTETRRQGRVATRSGGAATHITADCTGVPCAPKTQKKTARKRVTHPERQTVVCWEVGELHAEQVLATAPATQRRTAEAHSHATEVHDHAAHMSR